MWADPATSARTPHPRPPSSRTTPLRSSSAAVQRFASDAGMDAGVKIVDVRAALAPLPAHMVWPCRSSPEFLLMAVGVQESRNRIKRKLGCSDTNSFFFYLC